MLNNKTPYEILMGTVPSYSHLKVLGYLCFASTLSRNISKFDHRAFPCVFLGYPYGVKGYKLFNLETKSIFLSKDVIFHEYIFPFHSMDFHLNNASNSLPLFAGSLFPPPTFTINDSPMEVSEPVIDTHTPHIPDSTIHSPYAMPDQHVNPDPNPVTLDPVLDQPVQSDQPVQLVHEPINPAPSAPRKSSRPHKAPTYLQDFHCQLASANPLPLATTHFPIESILSYDRLSTPHRAFIIALFVCAEPKSYAEATRDPRWQAAMSDEIHALEINNTWQLTPLPASKVPIGCKWLYKVKHRADRSVERFKARLVAKGYTQ